MPQIKFRATTTLRVSPDIIVSPTETAEMLKPLNPTGEAGELLLRKVHRAITTFNGRTALTLARADYPTSRAMLLRLEERASQIVELLDQISLEFGFALDYLRTRERENALPLMRLQAELGSLARHARDAHGRFRPKPRHRPKLEHHREAVSALLRAFEEYLERPVKVSRSRGSTHDPHLKGPEGGVLVRLIRRVDPAFSEASLARLITSIRREQQKLAEQLLQTDDAVIGP